MRVPLLKVLIPYIIIIIIIENKIFSSDIILLKFLLIFIFLLYVFIKIKRLRIIVFFFIISLYNLILEYNFLNIKFNLLLPKREATIQVIFDQKKLIEGDIYYVGLVKDININKKYLENLTIYSKLINFKKKNLENKNLILKGILTYINQNGYPELFDCY